jgi:hypothetical protein
MTVHDLSDDPYRRCGLRANPFANHGPDEAVSGIDRGLLPAAPAPGGRRLVRVTNRDRALGRIHQPTNHAA